MYLRLLLIAAACFGCKRDDGAKVELPDLQIVSAGNEPRMPLHYRATKGATQQLAVAVDVEVSAGEMGGAMPTILMTLSIKVEDVLPTGAMRLRTTVIDTAALDRDETRVPTAALSGPLELMKGIAFTTTMSPTGRLAGTRIELGTKQFTGAAKAQLAALTTSFDHLMMTLPDEPVGIGAVWRNSKPLEQNGMKMTAVNSVQLVAITGDKLELAVDTEVHGADQTIKQGDLSVDVKDVTGTGSGKTSVDLRTLAVTSELSTEFRAAMQAKSESAGTPMKMSITTRVAPK